MQRQYTIELRVDYADVEKNPIMRKAMAQAARHVLATASLLSDGQEPKVVMFSDDFFTGHEEIPLMADVLGAAIDKHGGQETGVSDELLKAMTATQGEKPDGKA